jgi:Arc/MetJ-type ribon-helix-helix transcriptional regulator
MLKIISVSLTPAMRSTLEHFKDTGLYASRGEMIRKAIRDLLYTHAKEQKNHRLMKVLKDHGIAQEA